MSSTTYEIKMFLLGVTFIFLHNYMNQRKSPFCHATVLLFLSSPPRRMSLFLVTSRESLCILQLCLYICLCVYICVCTSVRVHLCAYVFVHLCTYVQSVYICTSVHCTPLCVYILSSFLCCAHYTACFSHLILNLTGHSMSMHKELLQAFFVAILYPFICMSQN